MKKNKDMKANDIIVPTEKAPPLLTIVIPVRNCAASCLRMLQEIDTQRRLMDDQELAKRLCVLVGDDASDDETCRFLLEWGYDHKCVEIFATKERLGAGGVRNRCAVHAMERFKSKYIAFFDADDFLFPRAIQSIMKVLATDKVDCVQWGFRTINPDKSRDRAWIPKYGSPDDWVTAPVAPWIHAIRSHLVEKFPEQLTTDDTIWWFRQAQLLQQVGAAFYFIHEPLYVYDRRSGGCTRASDYFLNHPTTLEAAAVDDVCLNRGYPDRYISDCLRNLAEMYDMRNTLSGRVREQFFARFNKDIAACMTGHWGW